MTSDIPERNNNFIQNLIDAEYEYCSIILMCVGITANVIDIGWTYVRLSVHLSVRHMLVLCQKSSTYR